MRESCLTLLFIFLLFFTMKVDSSGGGALKLKGPTQVSNTPIKKYCINDCLARQGDNKERTVSISSLRRGHNTLERAL
uniref:Secreted protein n=1 Tax=Picea glauca TaxID=3330 RepID=A0A101LUA9_PICGL|nr:hypothetical protein ABT39_MTgene2597 [Picea glauca]QHR87075.1 hypothetical protein Q903MT_gene1084 [Picea sitchensis]